MEERPLTKYATAPDGVSLAYQVIGNGPLDLVFYPGLALPIDLLWEDPGFSYFAKRLGRFAGRCGLKAGGSEPQGATSQMQSGRTLWSDFDARHRGL